MYGNFQKFLSDELASIEAAGLYKKERNIASAQSAEITLEDGSKALNFCANNYLGLADNPRLIEAAKKMMDIRGYGMSSVRFICGKLGVTPEFTYAGGERGWIGDNPFIYLDTKKVRSLGWAPKATIEEGVIKTVEYLQANPWVFEARD